MGVEMTRGRSATSRASSASLETSMKERLLEWRWPWRLWASIKKKDSKERKKIAKKSNHREQLKKRDCIVQDAFYGYRGKMKKKKARGRKAIQHRMRRGGRYSVKGGKASQKKKKKRKKRIKPRLNCNARRNVATHSRLQKEIEGRFVKSCLRQRR